MNPLPTAMVRVHPDGEQILLVNGRSLRTWLGEVWPSEVVRELRAAIPNAMEGVEVRGIDDETEAVYVGLRCVHQVRGTQELYAVDVLEVLHDCGVLLADPAGEVVAYECGGAS